MYNPRPDPTSSLTARRLKTNKQKKLFPLFILHTDLALAHHSIHSQQGDQSIPGGTVHWPRVLPGEGDPPTPGSHVQGQHRLRVKPKGKIWFVEWFKEKVQPSPISRRSGDYSEHLGDDFWWEVCVIDVSVGTFCHLVPSYWRQTSVALQVWANWDELSL